MACTTTGPRLQTHPLRSRAPLTGARWGAGFAAVGRFVAEIEAAAAGKGPLRAGYVLAGDEVFLLSRCREAVLKAFVPQDLRDFCLSDLDLATTSIFEVLDRAQTPSLMAPFQVIFVRNVRQLYTRGAKKDEFAALDRYFKSPNPAGPADLRRRLPPHPLRRPPHGDGRQEPLRAPHGNTRRALRHGRAGPRQRRRRHALDRNHRAGSRRAAWSPTQSASWSTRSART